MAARYGALPLASRKRKESVASARPHCPEQCGAVCPGLAAANRRRPWGGRTGGSPRQAMAEWVATLSERATNSGHRGSAQLARRYPGRGTPIVQLEYECGQGRCGAAGGAAAHQPEEHLEQDLSSSGCLEEAVQQPDRRNRRDALRGQVARDHLGHLPTREAAPSTQCEAGVRDWAEASSGSRQP